MPQGEGTYGSKVGRPPKKKSSIGNPEGGGSPDMDFATKRSRKKGFDFKSEKPKNRPDWSSGVASSISYGEKDYSPHNISARKTEGTIKEQEARKGKGMPYSPYKMKGSPMKRNFPGMVGTSPSPTKVVGELPAIDNPNAAPPPENIGVGGFGKAAQAVMGAQSKGGGVTPHGDEAHTGAGGAEAPWEAMKKQEFKGMERGARKEYMQGLTPEQQKQQRMSMMDETVGQSNLFGMGRGGGGGFNPFSAMSDIRAKEKIQRTGASPSGIPIYEFNYIGGEARYSGAMAQDLLEMNIDAVSMGEDGYYRVNYNNIDVDMHQIN